MQSADFLKRAWARIDLTAAAGNLAALRSLLPSGCKVMAVVKADAYGHGVRFLAPSFSEAGADWFGVSNLDEALQLRDLGLREPILIMGYTPPDAAKILHENRISQTAFSGEYAAALSAAAAGAGVDVNIHIKIDTGMSRLGFLYQRENDETVNAVAKCCRLPGLCPEGIFTHFACADYSGDPSGDFTRLQGNLFISAVKKLEERGVRFKLRHACNSAGILNFPEFAFDMVRPGIALYGLHPASGGQPLPAGMKPVMELCTVVSMVKTLPPGAFVSYGRTYQTDRDTVAATLPIGYADGFIRDFRKAKLSVNGHFAPVIGTVCMDQTVIDVTGIPGVAADDEVSVFGGKHSLTADQLAAAASTINYELVCIVGKRVPRIFLKDGKVVGQLNYVHP